MVVTVMCVHSQLILKMMILHQTGGGADMAAVAIDDNTVQAVTTDISQLTLIHTQTIVL